MTWQQVRLKDLGDWYGGGTPSKSRPDYWADGSIPWLSPKDMGPEILHSTQDAVTADAVAGSSVRLVPPNSVAVVVRSGILARKLPVAQVPFATTLNQDMKAVVPRPDIDSRWIAWGLRAFEPALLRETRKAGTTVASIEMPRFHDFELPVPPLDEQRRIVGLLEDHLSRLDAAVGSLRKSLRRADAMVVSSLAAQVTDGRESWISSTVGAHAEIIQYGSGAKCDVRSVETDVPVLRMGNVKDGALDWGSLKYLPSGHDDFPKLLLQPGDLLFNRTNSAEHVGKSAVFDADCLASFASYLIRVRFRPEVLPGWASMVINSPTGRDYVASVVSQQVGQANVNGTKLKAFPLPLPTRYEQERRIKEHSEVLESRARLRGAVDAAISRAVGLRRSLLSAAFSGQLSSHQSIGKSA